MEETDILHPIPSNFVSLQKLQELRIKDKQQKEKEKQDEEKAELERAKVATRDGEITIAAPTEGFIKKKKKNYWGHRPKLQNKELGASDPEELKQNMKTATTKKKMKMKMENKTEKEGNLVEEKLNGKKEVESMAENQRSSNPTVKDEKKSNCGEKSKGDIFRKKTGYKKENFGGISGGNNRTSSSSSSRLRNGNGWNGKSGGGENLMWVKKSDGGDANGV